MANIKQQEIRERAPFLVVIHPATDNNEAVSLTLCGDQRPNVSIPPKTFVLLPHLLVEVRERGLREALFCSRTRRRSGRGSLVEAALLELAAAAARARFVTTGFARHPNIR
jgi:hypothetical protein